MRDTVLGKKSIRVNEDGQVVVTDKFIDEEVILQLDRRASLKLAMDILKAQGVAVPDTGKAGGQ